MVNYKTHSLQISIPESDPAERRDWLIKAIAAAMRWNAMATGKYSNDNENLYCLAQLLEELIEIEKTVG